MTGDGRKPALSVLRTECLSAGGCAGVTAPGPAAAGELAAALEEAGPDQVLYEDPYHTVYRLAVRFRDVDKVFRVIESGSRAGVLPVRGDEILLVRQYRLLVNGLSWEIPGGRVEEGEAPQDAAIRECFEETGVECRHLQALAGYHPGMDVFCNPTYLYYSTDVREGASAALHQGETVDMAWFPLEEALGMILSMHIVDAFTMIGILTYKLRRDLLGRAVVPV